MKPHFQFLNINNLYNVQMVEKIYEKMTTFLNDNYV